eukprot:Rmarinus@m.15227
MVLALLPGEGLNEPVVLSACAGPVTKNIEQAGWSYLQLCLKKSSVVIEETREETTRVYHGEDGEEVVVKRATDETKVFIDSSLPVKFTEEHEGLIAPFVEEEDQYELLGLKGEVWLATENQIRKAYQRRSLRFHPDKNSELPEHMKDMVEVVFKKVNEAYENLNDPRKRLEIDSGVNFDDSIAPKCEHEDFFNTFRMVFSRNARWSVEKGVPDLGDHSTPEEECLSFYEFWYNFQSWRVFKQDDEHELDQASCREERRWMERENKRLRDKAKKNESARIRKLVDNAYASDPRIAAYEERLKQEKIAQREAKKAARRAKYQAKAQLDREREEEKQKEREEEMRRQEIEEEARKLAKKAKEQHRKLRQRLRKLTTDLNVEDEATALGTYLETEVLQDIVEVVGGLPEGEERKQRVLDFTNAFKEKMEERRKECEEQESPTPTPTKKPRGQSLSPVQSTKQKVEVKADLANDGEGDNWTPEELSLLSKAFTRYPGGTKGRWGLIATYIGTKSAKQVIAKAKSMADRQNLVSTVVKQSEDEQFRRSQAHTLSKAKKAASLQREKEREENAVPVASSTAPIAETTNDNEWGPKEQKQLEAGLRQVPSKHPERWQEIAKHVQGRTPAECKARYSYLREMLKAQKQNKK